MRSFPLCAALGLGIVALTIGCRGASQHVASLPAGDPAGPKFDEWLSAFNAADRSRLERVYANGTMAKFGPEINFQLAKETGGYDLHHVEAAGPTERIALVKEKKTGVWRCLKFVVQSERPHGIQGFMFGHAIDPGDEKVGAPLPPLDDQGRREVIDALAREIERAYVFADKAIALARELRTRQSEHAYDVPGRIALLRAVNQDLRRVSEDGHLRLDVSCSSAERHSAALASGPLAETSEPSTTRPRNRPSMLAQPQRLDGDVAYVEVGTFEHPIADIRDEVRDKMSAVADAAAIIFDLRQNGGGLPEPVTLLTSYISGEEPVQLGSTYKRVTNKTEVHFTDPTVPGSKFGAEKPVYVLTSRGTFSAAESFAYDLQARKRATIVGEKTGGGAHPGDVVRLGHGFVAFIPDGRVIHPVTKTDWEGVGVKPDVEVPADKALETAHKLALERLRTKR